MAQQKSKKLMEGLEEVEAARQKVLQPSFTTTLFAGRPRFDLVAPFPEQPSEDKKIGDDFCVKVEEFLRAYVDPDEIERTEKIPNIVFEKAFEMGLFGMKVPKEYGGLGLTQTNYNRILALVASWCNVFSLTLSAHQSIGVSQPLLILTKDPELKKTLTPELLARNEEQKKKYLPRVAREQVSAFALTEPSVGSDPASMKVEAVLNQEGTHFIVNGQKLWCTNGAIAGVIVLMARVPSKKTKDAKSNTVFIPCPEGKGADDKPITSFIVEMDSQGIKILERCRFEGCRGIENAHIEFTNVAIPVENVIGEIGKGLKYALTILNTGRVSIDAIVLGMAKQVWEPTLEWANFRKTFGKTLGQHESQTMRIARMASSIFATDAATWLVSQMADEHRSDIRVEAALTKVFCSEAAIQVIRDAQVIMGGRGYETADSKRFRGEAAFPMEQLVRDIEMYRIGEGSTDILIPFFSREALDPHLEIAKGFLEGHGSKKLREFLRLTKFYTKWYFSQWIPRSISKNSVGSDLGKDRLSYVEYTSRRLARNILYMLTGNLWTLMRGKATAQELRDRQGTVARIAKTGLDLFMISATTLYAAHQEEKYGRPGAWDLADQFFRDAKKRIEGDGYFMGLEYNDDKRTIAVGRKALEGKYNWLSEGAAKRNYKP
jgi:hypothetical protein